MKVITPEEKAKAKENAKIINDLVMNWQNTFGNLKHWNQELNGYTLNDIEVTDYGLSARIYAPWGIDIFDLEKHKSIIESGCKCEFLYNIPQHRQFAMAKFVYPNQVKINEWEFKPVKVKPWEFCPGYDVSGQPVKFNINDTPHILDAGMQRKGKNGAIDHAIINWIYSCDETEITFYLFQCAKNDLVKYKNLKQVYCYADSLEKILIALEHLEGEMKRRTALFEPMVSKADGNDNIYHYNKLHKTSKLPYIIIVIDEFIELMPDATVDDKDTKYMKSLILKHLRQIGQWGGSLGINYCILHQKPSRELMPTFIKNQSSIRVCFGFEDLVCCAIVLGDELAKYAHKLPPRKAYYSNNENSGYMYTSNLKGRINMFIKDSIQPNHRTLFDDLEKLNKKPDIKLNETEFDNEDFDIYLKSNGTAPIPQRLKDKKITKEIPTKQENKEEFKEKLNENENKSEPIEQIVKENITPVEVKYTIPNGIMEFNNVDPTKIIIDKQKLLENIKKIPNFVPFNNNLQPVTVIDKTQIDFSKTEKPKKDKEVN